MNFVKPSTAKRKLPIQTLPIWNLRYLVVDSEKGSSLLKYQLVAAPPITKSLVSMRKNITQNRQKKLIISKAFTIPVI